LHNTGWAATPILLALRRRPTGVVAAGDHQGRAQVLVDVAQVQLRRADLHRQLEGRIVQQAARQLHRQIVEMQLGTDETGVATPDGLADHMAVGAERRLRQFDHTWQVQIGQPQRVAVEHAFVVIDQAGVVPVLRLQCVDGGAQFGNLAAIQHTSQQREALLVQGLQMVRDVLVHGCAPLREVLSMLARA
jgi:hypothetical protein